jgi:hypothetical protein
MYFKPPKKTTVNLEETQRFLDVFNQPKLNQEDISHINRYSSEIEAVEMSLPPKNNTGPNGVMA